MFFFDNDQIKISILTHPQSPSSELLKDSLSNYKDYIEFIEFKNLKSEQFEQKRFVIFFDDSLEPQDLLIQIQKTKFEFPEAILFYYCNPGQEQTAQQCLAIGVSGFIYKDRPQSIWPTLKHIFNLKYNRSNAYFEASDEDVKFQKIFKQLDRALLAADSFLWEIHFPSFKTNIYSAQENVLGWKLDKLMDKFESWKNLIHPEDREYVLNCFENHLKNKTEYRVEYRFLSANGDYIWTLSIGQAEWDENNTPLVIYGVSTNIDSFKQTKSHLQKTSDQFQAFFNNSKDALFIIDTNTFEIMDCNQQACDLYGYTKKELLKMSVLELSLEVEKTQHAFVKRAANVSIRKHKKKDGTPFFIEVSSGYFEADGRVLNAAAVRDITQRVHDQNQIKTALAEKELLLKEVFHRVKNNLQIVVSIFKVQIESVKDETTKNILEQCIHRVMSMSLAHEQLYKRDSFAFVDINEYLNNLAQYLIHSDIHPKHKIQWSLEGDNQQLSLDQIIPLGLIVNELITNSLKHAFFEIIDPKIKIDIKTSENRKTLQLIYSDNGPGLTHKLNSSNSKNLTVGLHLIQLLSRQLDGQIDFENKNGLQFTLKLPLKNKT